MRRDGLTLFVLNDKMTWQYNEGITLSFLFSSWSGWYFISEKQQYNFVLDNVLQEAGRGRVSIVTG